MVVLESDGPVGLLLDKADEKRRTSSDSLHTHYTHKVLHVCTDYLSGILFPCIFEITYFPKSVDLVIPLFMCTGAASAFKTSKTADAGVWRSLKWDDFTRCFGDGYSSESE
jgi:hypothetical protein